MKIHFIGIGGIGISALAQYYLEKGAEVSGSDLVASEITDFLKKKGAKIFTPHHPALFPKRAGSTGQVGKHKLPDLVIYSPAISENNPELKDAKRLGIKCLSYPQVLGELTKKYFTIAVSGTHGKSTTTAMLAMVLIKAGFDPTVVVGTKLKEFGNSNFRIGSQYPISNIQYPILVIEADEWNASFLNYWPKIIVLTNIEREHLDYYKNLNHILKTFGEYVGHLPKDGVLVANGNDINISKLKAQSSKPQFKTQNYSLNQIEVKKLKEILKVPGEHNISNALAALTVARILKIPDKVSFKALSEYKGAWRRFEEKDLKIKNLKLKIISDYGHHPTEIRVTLQAAREKFLKKKIWCVFQPHQYQRTFYLFKDFVKVFSQAPIDKIIITDIYDVAGRENTETKKKVSSEKLVKEINKSKVVYLPKEKIKKYLIDNVTGDEIIIIMGAGDIYKIISNFKK